MLTVSELSKTTQMTPDAIRHYVRIGLLIPSRDPVNGYRLFSDYDIKKVKFIRRAKGLGFTLNDIQTIFYRSRDGQSPCPAVRDMIKQRMDDALEKWKSMPDAEPDGEAICHLIESVV